MKYLPLTLITGIGGLLITGNLILGDNIVSSIFYYALWIGEIVLIYSVMWFISLLVFGEVSSGGDAKAILLLVLFGILVYWQSNIVSEFNMTIAHNISEKIQFKEADSGIIIKIPGSTSGETNSIK